MRKPLLAFALFASTLTAQAAGQYDGIWLESADGTYTVYSTIYTASNGIMYKIDVEPEAGQTLGGSWDATVLGPLLGNTATLSGESKLCNLSYSLTFTSGSAATMRILSATAKPGKSCDVPQGGETTLRKLL